LTATGGQVGANRPKRQRMSIADMGSDRGADDSFDAVTLQFASRHLEIIRAFKERLTASGYRYTGYTCSITNYRFFFFAKITFQLSL
jgi:hypothetical protein